VPFKKNRLSGLASWWQTYNKKFHILTILDSAHISKATMLKFDAKGGPGTPSIAPNFVIIAQGDSSLRGKILQKNGNFRDFELPQVLNPHFYTYNVEILPGPKISQNVNYTHREGRWRGRRPRARHGGAKRRSAEGVGSGRGAVTPPQYGCLEASPSENFEI